MLSLAEIRVSKGKTQEDMAKALNVGISTYNQYENSQRNIPADLAEKIANMFDVDINDIFLPVRFTVSKSKKDQKQSSR